MSSRHALTQRLSWIVDDLQSPDQQAQSPRYPTARPDLHPANVYTQTRRLLDAGRASLRGSLTAPRSPKSSTEIRKLPSDMTRSFAHTTRHKASAWQSNHAEEQPPEMPNHRLAMSGCPNSISPFSALEVLANRPSSKIVLAFESLFAPGSRFRR